MATKKKPGALSDLHAVTDPTAPVDSPMLLKAARPVLKQLEADLTQRAKGSPAVTLALTARHQQERDARRTADAYPQWLEHFVEQVAAAWFLSCVFVRTLEDRGLLGQNRIAGPGALDSQRVFLELAPSLSERDYLLFVFRELTRLPAAKALFDARHNPVWMLAPSAEAAKSLLQLFRSPNAEAPALRFGQADTRVLGDLYQDLNENVRKRFALLQTPGFVEAFILDRTLTPAIQKFGLDATDIIDPTCGSGHFLLGAFERLYDQQLLEQPGLSPREAARLALDKVYGADINPYAVAVARFRLTLAYLEKAGFSKLGDAPELPLHVVVADSLLHNPQLAQRSLMDLDGLSAEDRVGFGGREFRLEDPEAAQAVMTRKYAAVVGNPPYITVKDAVLRERYREMYATAAGKYAVSVPFTERFFQLGRVGARVGMITANSFMKREFGKKLIEQFLPTVNLDLIANTSGAYIPGHGTPTVLLFGSCEAPAQAEVLAVLAKRGEPTTPADPEQGHVWRAIADRYAVVGFENDYVSVAAVPRADLATHPWSLGGGGVSDLKALIQDAAPGLLGESVSSIGFMAITGEDDIFARPAGAWERAGAEASWLRRFGTGERIRDWACEVDLVAFFPYTGEGLHDPSRFPIAARALWPHRRILLNRPDFGGKKYIDVGRPWHSYHQVPIARLKTPLSITFAFVATHNHFVLDRGGTVFKQSAPIIKLHESATEEDHLALLAYLNSSTACFWMKQVFYPKATSTGDISIEKGKPEANRYEFAGTGLLSLPLPAWSSEHRTRATKLARELSTLAAEREAISGAGFVSAAVEQGVPPHVGDFEARREAILARMLSAQEELDWLVYDAFGLGHYDPVTDRAYGGSRPFERPLDVPLPSDAPREWDDRRKQIATSTSLQMMETPVYKRLWSGRRGVFGHSVSTLTEDIRSAAAAAVQDAAERLLRESPTTAAIGQLSQDLATDRLRVVASLLTEGDDLAAAVAQVLRGSEAMPYLAALRFTEAGLAKHAQWQHTWELQREEDASGKLNPSIPVPPKYDQKDFRDARYWSLRGKLDVPKERFISYPGCESDEDGEPVYGWAGWDHLQRAQALVALYNDRKGREGWGKERLVPMLAGVLELIPWLKQWHNEPSAEFDGLRMGESYEAFLDGECRGLGLTREVLVAWRPESRAEARAVASAKKAKPKMPRKARKGATED